MHPKTGAPFDKSGNLDFKAAGIVKNEGKITQTGNLAGDWRHSNSTPYG
jgi:hypothetical protein